MVTTWRERAQGLAGAVAADGVLRTAAWRAALEAVPRHAFVPRFYEQRLDGTWAEMTSADDGWLAAAYRNEPLVTELATDASGHRVAVASAARPTTVVRMLEALDVRDEHRVLEIGCGYTAALLAHRLGAAKVFSVDSPSGNSAHPPFDRIIAMCPVAEVPWSWAAQVREGGLLLVDLELNAQAGNLVLLTRQADRLEGRFLPRGASLRQGGLTVTPDGRHRVWHDEPGGAGWDLC